MSTHPDIRKRIDPQCFEDAPAPLPCNFDLGQQLKPWEPVYRRPLKQRELSKHIFFVSMGSRSWGSMLATARRYEPEGYPDTLISLYMECIKKDIKPFAILQHPSFHVVEEKFRRLAAQWREETINISSLTRIIMHPAYQQIIGIGLPAVPLLLRELAKEPSHWFWALQSITGENPVPAEDKGNLEKSAMKWLDWGKTNGWNAD